MYVTHEPDMSSGRAALSSLRCTLRGSCQVWNLDVLGAGGAGGGDKGAPQADPLLGLARGVAPRASFVPPRTWSLTPPTAAFDRAGYQLARPYMQARPRFWATHLTFHRLLPHCLLAVICTGLVTRCLWLLGKRIVIAAAGKSAPVVVTSL